MHLRISFIFLIFSLLFVESALSVEVLIRKKGRKKYKKVDWYTYSEEKWITNDEGVPLWSEIVTIDLPKAYKKATSKKYNEVQLLNKGRKVKVNLSSMYDKLRLKGNGKKTVKVRAKWDKDLINNKLCEDLGLYLEKKSADRVTPFRIDINCYQKEEDADVAIMVPRKEDFLVVVVPKEVEWISTKLKETNGRGKHWREYKVADFSNDKNNVISDFTFAYRGEEYKFALKTSKPLGVSPTKEGSTNFYLGAGQLNLSIISETTDQRLAAQTVFGTIETTELWKDVRLGASFILPQFESPSDPSVQSLEFFEARLFAAKDIKVSETLSLFPMVVGVFSESTDPNASIKIIHQHIGFGIGGLYRLAEAFDFEVAVWNSGFLASKPSSQNAQQFRFYWQVIKSFGIGLEYSQQGIAAEGEIGVDNEMSENRYGLFLKF